MRKITSGIIQRGCGCNIIKAQYRIGPYIYVLWEVSTNGRSSDNCSSVDISYYSLKQIALLCYFETNTVLLRPLVNFCFDPLMSLEQFRHRKGAEETC